MYKTIDFPKKDFEKILSGVGYSYISASGWTPIQLENKEGLKINFINTIFHKSFHDECGLILVKSKEVLLGIITSEALIKPVNKDQFIVFSHNYYQDHYRLEITLVNAKGMRPISGSLDEIVPTFMETVPNYPNLMDLKSDFQCYFPGGVEGKGIIENEQVESNHRLSFDEKFHQFNEILIPFPPNRIYQLLPSKGEIHIWMQNWFKKGFFEDWQARSYGIARDPDSQQIFGYVYCWKPEEPGYPFTTKYFRIDTTDTNLEAWLELVE